MASDSWHSFDSSPWRYPWINKPNLQNMWQFSRMLLDNLELHREKVSYKDLRFALVGNMANFAKLTRDALGDFGNRCWIIPHPHDLYHLSQPEWEEYEGQLSQEFLGDYNLGANLTQSIQIPRVIRGFQIRNVEWNEVEKFANPRLYERYKPWYGFSEVFQSIQKFDAAIVTQSQYLAYLSGIPYIAFHSGGDIWFECSRNDQLGLLQRESFVGASVCIASNPWSYAFARRYDFTNFITLPTIINLEKYSPGPRNYLKTWKSQFGGDFFILTTARIDNLFKGSNVILNGFEDFVRRHDSARLLVIGWGNDLERFKDQLYARNLEDKIHMLPPAGKSRLIQYLRSADLLIDAVSVRQLGMTAIEGLAIGRPVIMDLDTESYEYFLPHMKSVPPILQASSSEEITNHLQLLFRNPRQMNVIGKASREWVENYMRHEKVQRDYENLMIAVATGYPFDFTSSPLVSQKSPMEREYLADQLSKAPFFPNYFL